MISSLALISRTATNLSVTWSAGYSKCYSFTVSRSTQDGSVTVTQPADSDTSHTLTSLQPGTTYRIEVEAVRKGEGADGQRAKVMGNFTTEGEDGITHRIFIFMALLCSLVTTCVCLSGGRCSLCSSLSLLILHLQVQLLLCHSLFQQQRAHLTHHQVQLQML